MGSVSAPSVEVTAMSSLLAANNGETAALADELAKLRIVEPTRLTELMADFSGSSPAELTDYLHESGVLTTYQAEKIMAVGTRAIAVGPYRITGLVGAGTFG